MDRIILSVLLVVGGSCLVFKDAAAFISTVDCEYGAGLVPVGPPDPNILCEMTWEDTGLIRVAGGKFGAQLTVDGVLADELSTAIFRFATTPQPVHTFVKCSNVTAFMSITAQATMFFREPPKTGGGWSFYDFDSDFAAGEVPSNGGAGCTLGGG